MSNFKSQVKRRVKELVRPFFVEHHISPKYVRQGGHLSQLIPQKFLPPYLEIHEKVEKRATATHQSGDRPLWDGYKVVGNYPRTDRTRKPNEVRSTPLMGRFYSWLAEQHDDPTIVEFGTAFGVSGMYWLAGMKSGHLYTFEPNEDWARSADENLRSIADFYTLTVDTFEAAGPKLLVPKSVDIAFIDAIHTSEFVLKQFSILKPLMKSGGFVILDDITFSPDMANCWRMLANSSEIVASATLTRRVGIIELA
jgi:predicted O-methyltransferase YrrM